MNQLLELIESCRTTAWPATANHPQLPRNLCRSFSPSCSALTKSFQWWAWDRCFASPALGCSYRKLCGMLCSLRAPEWFIPVQQNICALPLLHGPFVHSVLFQSLVSTLICILHARISQTGISAFWIVWYSHWSWQIVHTATSIMWCNASNLPVKS